jgi:hypothetical protein
MKKVIDSPRHGHELILHEWSWKVVEQSDDCNSPNPSALISFLIMQLTASVARASGTAGIITV